jgi:hypothetical protein
MCQRLGESYIQLLDSTSCESPLSRLQHTRWTPAWTSPGSNATQFTRGLRRRSIMRLSFFLDNDLNESPEHLPTFFPWSNNSENNKLLYSLDAYRPACSKRMSSSSSEA